MGVVIDDFEVSGEFLVEFVVRRHFDEREVCRD